MISKKKVKETRSDKTRDLTVMVQKIGVLQESMSHDLQAVLEVATVADQRLDRLETKVGQIDETLVVMKDDIEIIKYDLKKKVSLDDFAMLEKRVAALEKKTNR